MSGGDGDGVREGEGPLTVRGPRPRAAHSATGRQPGNGPAAEGGARGPPPLPRSARLPPGSLGKAQKSHLKPLHVFAVTVLTAEGPQPVSPKSGQPLPRGDAPARAVCALHAVVAPSVASTVP